MAAVLKRLSIAKVWFGLWTKPAIVNTERQHESTRVLAPANDSVLSTFTVYQRPKLPDRS